MTLKYKLNDLLWSRPPLTCKGETAKLHEVKVIRTCETIETDVENTYKCVNRFGQSDAYKESELYLTKDAAIAAYFEFTEFN